MTAERADELSSLCRACGACCSGAMFSHVVLDPDELAGDTRRRLKVVTAEDGKERFAQPCRALVGSDCGVYLARPRVCSSYKCGLYEAHERSGGALAPRIAKVRRVRELLDKLAARGDRGDGDWLPAPINEIVQWDAGKLASLRESLGEVTLLDIAELGMRVRRDLGHVPKTQ